MSMPIYRRTSTLIVAVLVAAFVGLWYVRGQSSKGLRDIDPAKACLGAHQNATLHIHPELRIIVDGTPVSISEGIGLSAGCMHPIHTHDASGKLHVEWKAPRVFTLNEFFAIWGKPFSHEQILEYKLQDGYRFTVLTDGEPREDWQNLVLKDAQVIEIKIGR